MNSSAEQSRITYGIFHCLFRPNSLTNLTNMSGLTAFIKLSASILSLATCTGLISCHSIKSQIAWYWIIMCLLRLCITGFSDNFIAKVLSINSVVGPQSYSSCFQTEYRKWQSHMACLAVLTTAMYSTSNDNVAIMGCFLLN